MPFDDVTGGSNWGSNRDALYLTVKDSTSSKTSISNVVVVERNAGIVAAPSFAIGYFGHDTHFGLYLPHIDRYAKAQVDQVKWHCGMAFFKTDEDISGYEQKNFRQTPWKKWEDVELCGYAIGSDFVKIKSWAVGIGHYGLTRPACEEMWKAQKNKHLIKKEHHKLYKSYIRVHKIKDSDPVPLPGASVIDSQGDIIGMVHASSVGGFTHRVIPAFELAYTPAPLVPPAPKSLFDLLFRRNPSPP